MGYRKLPIPLSSIFHILYPAPTESELIGPPGYWPPHTRPWPLRLPFQADGIVRLRARAMTPPGSFNFIRSAFLLSIGSGLRDYDRRRDTFNSTLLHLFIYLYCHWSFLDTAYTALELPDFLALKAFLRFF